MDSIQNPRIEHGLTELLSRIVPNLADEDDAEADQRFDDAYDFAFDMLSKWEFDPRSFRPALTAAAWRTPPSRPTSATSPR